MSRDLQLWPRIGYARVKRNPDPEVSWGWQREAVEKKVGPIPDHLWFRDNASPATFRRPDFERMVQFCRQHPQSADAPGLICMENSHIFGFQLVSQFGRAYLRTLRENRPDLYRVLSQEGRGKDLERRVREIDGYAQDAYAATFLRLVE